MTILYLNFKIKNLIEDSRLLIQEIYPNSDPKLSLCTNGITNKLVKADLKHTTILIRLYGKNTSILIDRKLEINNIKFLSSAGLSTPLIAIFANGIIYGYVDGHVFTQSDMKIEYKKVAKHLSIWHSFTTTAQPALFPTMRDWLSKIPKSNRYSISKLEKELNNLEHTLTKLDSKVVFCHNDLLNGNIIKVGNEVRFIDYEYGSWSYAAFDIANHFNEYAGFDCDYSLFPDSKYIKKWLKVYLSHQYSITHQINQVDVDEVKGMMKENDGRCCVSEYAVDNMYREVLAFSLASHFFWALWAMIQAEISDLDFDYLDYALRRLKEYDNNKSRLKPVESSD